MDEVVELRRMFGTPDYLLRVRAAITRADSRMTMKVIKHQRCPAIDP